MPRRSLVVLTQSYPSPADPVGGIFIHRGVKALRAAGIDAKVISPLPWAPGALWFNEAWRAMGQKGCARIFDGVEVVHPRYLHLPVPLLRHAGNVLAAFWALRAVLTYTRSGDVRALVAHRVYPEGFMACLMKRWLPVPVICVARGSDLKTLPDESALQRAITRIVLQKSDAVVAVSRDLAARASAIGGAGVAARVIYNGVDLEALSVRPARAEEKMAVGLSTDLRYVVYVGRCSEAKGTPELVAAFREVAAARRDVRLLLVGRLEKGLRSLMERAVEEGLVVATGQVDPGDVGKYLHVGDVFAFPSHSEGMPNALLEAMGSGLPSIATAVGGIPEVLVDGENGLLVPLGDQGALARGLARLLDDQSMAERLGAAAAATVRSRFSWKKNVADYEALCEELATATCRRPWT